MLGSPSIARRKILLMGEEYRAKYFGGTHLKFQKEVSNYPHPLPIIE